jgi:hypothetical protein
MFYLSVWQNEIILAMLGAGVLLTLGIVLTYMEIWRPRSGTVAEASTEMPRETLGVWFLSHVSWILVVIASLAGIWGLLYAIDKIVHPPNW